MSITVKAFGNSDHAIIAWRSAAAIPNCVGFAIYKKKEGQSDAIAAPLNNRVPFAGEDYTPGEQRPSTEWPFQRFLWSDFSVQSGDRVQYMVVPILISNNQLSKDDGNSSDWTPVVGITTGTTYEAYFNRGIVSSQFFARGLTAVAKQAGKKTATVKGVVTGPDSPLRSLMGGQLSIKLFALLDEVINSTTGMIYSALYELNQEDLIQRLCKLGKRAHVILADGTGAKKKTGKGKDPRGDENKAARKRLLAAHVDVHDRMVNVSQHYAHNKFLVVTDKNSKPVKAWTGSTNWSSNGLFAQVNNGILINDPAFAAIYLNEWEQIQKAGDEYPATFADYNKAAFGNNPRVWFAPTPALKDLADATNLMNKAKKGILFLIFNPGPEGTLFNALLDLQTKKPSLYVHGVVNQDPGTKGAKLILFHKGVQQEAKWNNIIAQNIKENTSFWTKEPKEMVTIHSKVIVIDPFTDNPIVMTGSHNLGRKASGKNDDNLNIISDPALAKEYAVNIMGVYDHYHWRYSVLNKASHFAGLTDDNNWMASYHVDQSETAFLGF